jgi:hypothetical protein
MQGIADLGTQYGDSGGGHGLPLSGDEARRLWFRFRDRNPITGTAYVGSLWEDLPYFIGRLVCEWWEITPEHWNRLAACGQAAALVGEDTYPVPLSLAPGIPLPMVLPTPGRISRCLDCDGRGVLTDPDGQMTGFPGAVYVCFCSEPVRTLEPSTGNRERPAMSMALVGEWL